MNAAADVLKGCRVLIVEDDMLLSMLLEDLLGELGCTIAGSASRFDEAVQKCRSLEFDVALLDINLRDRQTFPIAEDLRRRRRPFVFTTGYGDRVLPESLRGTVVLPKPYRRPELERALRSALKAGTPAR